MKRVEKDPEGGWIARNKDGSLIFDVLRGDFSIHMELARRAGKPEVFELVAWPPDGACRCRPMLGDAQVMQDMLNQIALKS